MHRFGYGPRIGYPSPLAPVRGSLRLPEVGVRSGALCPTPAVFWRRPRGEVAERSKAAVLKTVVG